MGKNIYLFILFILSSSLLSAQSNVQRENVLLEIFSGTWCVYCPGAALGADDMLLNGHDISIIEWHVGDVFQTADATNRDSYYNVTGYPSQVFDGTTQYSGGNPTTSVYPSYLSYYNSAIGVQTPIDLTTDISVVNGELQLESTANQVASLATGASPKLYIVLTESHIPVNWFGLEEVNFVQRYFYEYDLNLTVGSSETIQHTIPVDSNWKLENSEIVVFIQDPGSKVVYNSRVEKAIRHNAAVENLVEEISLLQCQESTIAPMLELTNKGADLLTSVDIEYSINGEPSQMINWTGSLEFQESENVQLPSFVFTPNVFDTNRAEIFLLNPNGIADQLPEDNQINVNWIYPQFKSGMYTLTIQPDLRGTDITWEMINVDGDTIASGGPYAFNDQSLITEQFDVGTEVGCHKFAIHDAGGDGLTAVHPGFYNLKNGSGITIIESADGNFGYKDEANFKVNFASKIDDLNPSLVHVFPNPSNGQFTVKMEEFAGQSVQLEIYQMNGMLLSSVKTSEGLFQFDLTNQPTGVYLLKVLTDQGQHLEKISRL